MFSVFCLLAQTAQAQRLPWAFLVLFGLMAVAAIALLIYFLGKLRKSEKESEDDWGLSSRGILLSSTQPASQTEKKASKTSDEPVVVAKEPEPVVGQEPAAEAAQATEAGQAAEVASAVSQTTVAASVAERMPTHGGPEALEGSHGLEQETSIELGHAAPEMHEEGKAESGGLHELDHAASPFDEEVWSQLESHAPAATPVVTEQARRMDEVPRAKERYEPPRIEPLTPRTDQAAPPRMAPIIRSTEPREAAPALEALSSPASASQQSSVGQARLEARPRVSKSAMSSAAPAGSILGLPAAASAGPLIIDRSRARSDAEQVGTLANYDKTPDDKAGHSGTIALVIVLGLVCGSLAAYLAVPPIHSRVDTFVAHVRGTDVPDKGQPVAQIFPAPYDNSKDPIEVKGSLQNISDHTLYGLVVTVSLQPKPGGEALTEYAQVTPDELQPSQQGSYDFQIDAKKYTGYRIVALKNRDGVGLEYNKPNQQQ